MEAINKRISKPALQLALHYMEGNPEQNIPKVVDVLLRIIHDEGSRAKLLAAKAVMDDIDNPYRVLIIRGFEELQPEVRKRFVSNFVVNASMVGPLREQALRTRHGCNIPWAILMDPTSACNLSCIGCWAGEYERADLLGYEVMDRIIREGKTLGVYFYIYTGGEPTLCMPDLIELARVHHDCMFLAFTNGTLVDQEVADTLSELGNFALAFSIEGCEEETDFRRGKGTYAAVLQGMECMHRAKAPFGFSACYHAKNVHSIASEEFLDSLIERGCMFGWYFTYMPLGTHADTTLLTRADQRAYMARWVRRMREQKPIFLMDFWNDGPYVEGCIAGGRRYLHINAAGDIEPCAFIHYANANIHDSTILQALQGPLFMAYKEGQPFNENHFRPCPLLDNPASLARMVRESGAHSTQAMDKEDVDELCAKCLRSAAEWGAEADRLRAEFP